MRIQTSRFGIFLLTAILLVACGDQEVRINSGGETETTDEVEEVDPAPDVNHEHVYLEGSVVRADTAADIHEQLVDGVFTAVAQPEFIDATIIVTSENLGTLEYRVSETDAWQAAEITYSAGRFHNAQVRMEQSVTQLQLRGLGHATFLQVEFYTDSEVVHEHEYDDVGDDIDQGFQGLNVPGPWSLPADVRRAGESQHVRYDRASSCSGGMTPGAVELGRYISDHFNGVRAIQGYNCRSIRGSNNLSMHATGRAIDIMTPLSGGKAANQIGDPIGNWLVTHSSTIGVQLIIWDRVIWNGSRSGTKHRSYGGVHPHHDHLHVEINRDAANRNTGFFTGNRPGVGPEPEPEPEPEPNPPGGCIPTADDRADGLFADFPPSATGYDEAEQLYNSGITQGCSSSPLMFCPNCPLSRTQLAVFLVRASGTSIPSVSQPTFSDVPRGHWAFDFVEAAAAAGITQGCGDGKFCPSDEVTRAQAATMIKRAAGWPDEVPANAPTFSDVPASSTHFAGIETLKTRCSTNGCGDGKFCPDDSLTRGQAAVFIARAFNLDDINTCAEPGGCDPTPVFGAENETFQDLPAGSRGYEEANLLFDAGITQGCSESPRLFCPHCPTNRRAMMVLLVRAMGLDTSNPPPTATFDDVPVGSFGFAEIEAGFSNHVVFGCGDGNFCPDDPVTRAQAASFLSRIQGWPEATPATPTYEDVDEGSTHYTAIETITERCVTDGCDEDRFCPDRSLSRINAAIFITRAFNLEGINSCAAL